MGRSVTPTKRDQSRPRANCEPTAFHNADEPIWRTTSFDRVMAPPTSLHELHTCEIKSQRASDPNLSSIRAST